jgi:hypothetical protein
MVDMGNNLNTNLWSYFKLFFITTKMGNLDTILGCYFMYFINRIYSVSIIGDGDWSLAN